MGRGGWFVAFGARGGGLPQPLNQKQHLRRIIIIERRIICQSLITRAVENGDDYAFKQPPFNPPICVLLKTAERKWGESALSPLNSTALPSHLGEMPEWAEGAHSYPPNLSIKNNTSAASA